LALALTWPASQWVLLDANARRGAFLEQVIGELRLHERVVVLVERAEEAAQAERWRGAFDLVTARSFGPPAVTAECASGFLRAGGRLVVSEPPSDAEGRWPPDGLSKLGLADLGRSGAVRVLLQVSATPQRFPRRVGVPAKRPLW
jgi:16S rRNA (guanine527-N7)-methyltransferase